MKIRFIVDFFIHKGPIFFLDIKNKVENKRKKMKIKNFTMQTLNSYENRLEDVTRMVNTKIITQPLKYPKKAKEKFENLGGYRRNINFIQNR